MPDPLGDLFKSREKQFRPYLPNNSLVCLRLDGKAFHTLTKQFKKPFDLTITKAMSDASCAVLSYAIQQGQLFGYTQSDEISIFFTDLHSPETQLPYGGNINKILSTSASAASTAFNASLLPKHINPPALFDARLHLLHSRQELHDYLTWRRLDSRKNAISAAAHHFYPHPQLQGLSTQQQHELLQDTPYSQIPEIFFEGKLIIPTPRWAPIIATRTATEQLVDSYPFLN